MASPELEAIIATAQQWSGGILAARSAIAIDAMSAALEAEAIAELPVAIATCVPTRVILDRANYMPVGNPYNKTGCERLQQIAYVLGRRRARAALPALVEIWKTSTVPQVRIVAGHTIASIGDRDAAQLVADGSIGETAPGWLRLWAGAQHAIDPASAYVACTDRVATSKDPQPLLEAIADFVWRDELTDPRWGDLCAMLLERSPRHHPALAVMGRLRDRRGVPYLVEESRSPDLNTVSIALGHLANILGPEIGAAVADVYATTTQRAVFAQVLAAAGATDVVAEQEAARTAAIAAQPRMFKFYGARPGDWFTASSHLYIVGFATTLDRAARARLGRGLRRITAVQFERDPWLWGTLDDRSWVQFLVGDDPFDAIEGAMTRIHELAPIHEAIFAGLREESDRDEWTIWSHLQPRCARVPALEPGATYQTVAYYAGRTVVPVTGKRDAEFERLRR